MYYLRIRVSINSGSVARSFLFGIFSQTRLKLVIDRFDMVIKLEECLRVIWSS